MNGQVIHNDAHASVSELAFGRYAMVSPHSSPNPTLFVVISGGGYVQVGSERSRINHGEAVVWPPDIPHGAYTDGSEMRAIVIEFAGGAQSAGLLEGRAVELREAEGQPTASPAEGKLAERHKTRDEYDASEGEPW